MSMAKGTKSKPVVKKPAPKGGKGKPYGKGMKGC